MQKDSHRITVLTCCYNYGQFFGRYLAGLLAQSRKPNKVMIVDDASTDDSFSVILQQLGTQTSELPLSPGISRALQIANNGVEFNLLQAETNGGPSKARNLGIKHSLNETDIYFVYDMDDMYYPDKISKSIEVFNKFPHVAAVYSDYVTLDTVKKQRKREFKEPFDYTRLCQECIVGNNSAISANALKIVGIYDETLRVAEDYDLWLRIAERGMIYHIPEALYEYSVTGLGATFAVKQDVWQECWKKVQEKRMERMNHAK